MAGYTPTLADTPQEGYQPSLADTPQESEFNPVQEMLNQIGTTPKPVTSWSQIGDTLGIPDTAQTDIRHLTGFTAGMTMPEFKWTPEFISNMLPELKGISKYATDYLSSIGKTGVSSAAGSEIAGLDNPTSAKAGAIGAGATAIGIPLGLATASMNPYARLVAGSGLGALLGYGTGQMTGGSGYTTTAGSIIGGLLGLRGSGASQIAASNVADAITPEQMATANARQAASDQIGVPLTLAEKTGSPILGAMQQNSAMSVPGSKILYNYGLQRQQAEENSVSNLLNQISPQSAAKQESQAYRSAFNNAEQNGTRVNTKPVTDYIDSELPQYEQGSKIAQALKQARARLAIIPATQQKQDQMFAPVTQIQQQLQDNATQLNTQLQQMKANAPDPYFRASTGYDQQVQQVQDALDQHNEVINNIQQQKAALMQASNMGSDTESTLEGLHNAKLGIQGIIEGQGDQAIGRSAAGKLKQVNKLLIQQMNNSSPEYQAVNQSSNLRQARQNIEGSMAASNYSGSNFYDKILANPKNYNELYQRLSDPQNPNVQTVPQQNIAAMRTAFPDLIDNLTAKSGNALAEHSAQSGMNLGDLAKSFLNKVYMNRYNKSIAELMVNPQWKDELANIANMKSGEDRGVKLGRLISKVAVSGYGGYQLNQQGSNQNGPGS